MKNYSLNHQRIASSYTHSCFHQSMMVLLFIFFILSFSTVSSVNEKITIITDYSKDDIQPLSSNCYPNANSGLCNLRSAWLACLGPLSESYCIIDLQIPQSSLQHTVIEFNQSFGELQLMLSENNLISANSGIEIEGNGNTIQPVGTPNTFGSPISYQYNTLTDTNDATVNTASMSILNKCPGDVITVYTISEYAGYGVPPYDPVIRLYVVNNDTGNIQIAMNDDYIVYDSLLTYTVPSYTVCADYIAEIGCYRDTSCNINTYTYDTSWPSQRFLFTQSVDTMVPYSVSINDLRLQGFGSNTNSVNGGAMYFSGQNLIVSVNNVHFNGSIGYFGGDIFLDQLNTPLISGCTFSNSKASNYGGSIFIDKSTTDVMLTDSTMTHCVAYSGGGCIYINAYNTNTTIYNVSMTDMSSSSSGGGVYINSYNSNLTMSLLRVSYGYSGNTGGCMYISNHNEFITIKQSLFYYCKSFTSGGAVMFSQFNKNIYFQDTEVAFASTVFSSATGSIAFSSYNTNITFSRMYMHHNAMYQGGGISVKSYNQFIYVYDSLFTSMTIGNAGGAFAAASINSYIYFERNIVKDMNIPNGYACGVFVNNDNDHIYIRYNLFTNLTTLYGAAGIFIEQYNLINEISYNNFTNIYSSAGVGGGIYLYNGNDHLLISNNNFINCIANNSASGVFIQRYHNDVQILHNRFINGGPSQTGGCVAVYQGNTNILIEDNEFYNCLSENGGGAILLYTTNVNVTLKNILIDHATGGLGGGIWVNTNNKNMSFENVAIRNASATSGGGIAFMQGNTYINLTNVHVSNCYASLVGGGIAFWKENKFIMLNNVMLDHSIASFGAGFFAMINNANITFVNSQIENNIAEVYGGGMYFAENNRFVTLYETNVINNTAYVFGGGVMFNKTNNNITIAGCDISYNAAYYGGGLFIGYTNQQVIITDTLSYTHTTLGQYIYNTIVAGILYEQNFVVPYTDAYVITFTIGVIGLYENLYIYGDDGVMLASYNADSSDFPGITLPSLYFVTKTLKISLVGVGSPPTYYYDDDGVATYDEYYGIEYIVTPVIATQDSLITKPTTIQNNYAGTKGGAAYFYSNNINVLLLNTLIADNTAVGAGGGIFFQLVQANTVISRNIFENNTAGNNGGAMNILAGNYGFQIMNNQWMYNKALSNGGAIYIGTTNGNGLFTDGNQISISNNTFSRNIALSGGGALYLDTENVVDLLQSVLQENKAYSLGGGLCLASMNHIVLVNCTLSQNTASEGGGISSVASQNILAMESNLIQGNIASRIGGGMIIDRATQVYFTKTNVFAENGAYFGGGIAAMLVDLWLMVPSDAKLIFQGNVASRGSALFCYPLYGSYATNVLNNITFVGNVATSGSTVYWLYGDLMLSEPPGLKSSSLIWQNNTALYGDKWGTQATNIYAPATYEVTVYGGNLDPPITLTMSDYYDQRMLISNDTTVYPALVTTDLLEEYDDTTFPPGTVVTLPQCHGFLSSISGSDYGGVVFSQGQAVFDGLQAYCAPGGNISVAFQALLGDKAGFPESAAGSFYLTTVTLMTFRPCVAGEYSKNGACYTCPQGSYSLVVSNDVSSCITCSKMSGVESCYADQLILEEGYWRRYPQTTAVLSCPLGSASCLGGNLTGQALCAEGYTGPLCSVCADGYYLNDGTTCDACADKSSGAIMSPSIIFIIILLILSGGIAAVIYGYCRALQPVVIDAGPTFLEVWVLWFKTKYGDMTVRAKIIISTYQIVIAASTIFQITMPSAFTSIANSLKVFNFNFSNIFPIGCATAGFNFIYELMWTTLFPMALTLCLFAAFWIEYLYLRHWIQANPNRVKGQKAQQFEATKNKYLNLFFYLTYLILPSVTTTIFQLFVCQNIDPNGEDNSQYDWYLKADMTISCQSTYYEAWLGYGVAMIIIYPIGIPLMYLWFLYRSRDEIANRNKKSTPDTVSTTPTSTAIVEGTSEKEIIDNNATTTNPMIQDEDKKANNNTTTVAAVGSVVAIATTPAAPTMSAQAMRIQFLWRAYEPQYWYWEVLETGRRIILTAVLSVVSPGSSEQNLLAILLSLMFIKLYSYFRPYLLDRNDVLAEMGQIQVFFTFLCAMTINNNLLSSAYANSMDALLVLTNFSVMGMLIFNSVNSYIDKFGWKDIAWLLPVLGIGAAVTVSTASSSDNKASSTQNSGRDEKHDGNVGESDIELATFKSSQQEVRKNRIDE